MASRGRRRRALTINFVPAKCSLCTRAMATPHAAEICGTDPPATRTSAVDVWPTTADQITGIAETWFASVLTRVPTDKPSGISAAPRCPQVVDGRPVLRARLRPDRRRRAVRRQCVCKAIQTTGIYRRRPAVPPSCRTGCRSAARPSRCRPCMSVGFEKDGVTSWAGGGTSSVSARIIKTEDSGRRGMLAGPRRGVQHLPRHRREGRQIVGRLGRPLPDVRDRRRRQRRRARLSAAQDAAVLPNGSRSSPRAPRARTASR